MRSVLWFSSPTACHILECSDGLAQSVISTIGQAFELQFKQYLHSPPKSMTSMERWCWKLIFLPEFFFKKRSPSSKSVARLYNTRSLIMMQLSLIIDLSHLRSPQVKILLRCSDVLFVRFWIAWGWMFSYCNSVYPPRDAAKSQILFFHSGQQQLHISKAEGWMDIDLFQLHHISCDQTKSIWNPITTRFFFQIGLRVHSFYIISICIYLPL